MRIVLQQKATGLYYQDLDKWTQDSREAFVFLSSSEALEFCSLNRIADHQLVFKFDQERFEIVPPQSPFTRRQACIRL